jgi:hypothetical protein
MKKIILKTVILGFLAGAFVCATASALAETASQAAATVKAGNDLLGDGFSSAAHFGFAVIDQSSTGFGKASGSMVFLDATKKVLASVDVGFRTLAQGGKRDGEFYRMGAGPLVNVKLTKTWSAQVSYGFFKETALDADGEHAYQSKGRNLMLGWERVMPLSAKVDLLWGGFFCHHDGSLDLASAISPVGERRYANATTNKGQTHGLEIALRMRL